MEPNMHARTNAKNTFNKFIIDCSDLYDDAAEKLKRLDNDIVKTIQDLAKNVEERGVPKNKVARIVVKELTAREVLSPSRIYEGLGVEQKRKYKKKETWCDCLVRTAVVVASVSNNKIIEWG
jgi:hypothetical protein